MKANRTKEKRRNFLFDPEIHEEMNENLRLKDQDLKLKALT